MGVFYLATVEGDQPRVRAFDSGVEHDGKIYFETTNAKNVYRQLLANPKFELFAMDDSGILRMSGEALEEKDKVIVDLIEDKIGKYLGDPTLAVFRIENAHATISHPDGTSEKFDL